MVAVDWYPQQEGRIADGLTINCIAGAAINESDIITFGTSTSGQITVIPAASVGDGWGIAIRAAASGDPVPVLVYGVYKVRCGEFGASFAHGEMAMNSGDEAVTSCEDLANVEASVFTFGGTSTVYGMFLQAMVTDADEVLLLVGKCI